MHTKPTSDHRAHEALIIRNFVQKCRDFDYFRKVQIRTQSKQEGLPVKVDKTDRRVQYTKRALTKALASLVRDQHISKASVKALCEAANVNRSTFYAHFSSPDDLLAHIEAEVLDELQAYLLTDDPSSHNVERILEYAQDNTDVFLMLLDESDGSFQQQIMKLTHLVDLQISDSQGSTDSTSADTREYMYLFAVSGALGMLAHWLKKGTPQTPAQMADLLVRMLQHGIEERS